jgi:hypothetical protein
MIRSYGHSGRLWVVALAVAGLLCLWMTASAGAALSSLPEATSAGTVAPPPAVTELPTCNEIDPQSRALSASEDPQITKIEGGGKKYSSALPGSSNEYVTVSEPPASFDPLTASAEELQTWGFAPRPTNKAGLEAWESFYGSYKQAKFHEGCLQTDPTKSHSYLGETFASNWSGYEDVSILNQKRWHGVFGRYYQPTDHGSCSESAEIASWVGLGGDPNYPGGERFIQAGTETEANGYTQAWIEWWAKGFNSHYVITWKPTGEKFIVEEGNYIRMSVYYNYSLEEYYVYITNDHTGETELIQGPLGHQFYNGGTAEWIDEPANGTSRPLNFDEIN